MGKKIPPIKSLGAGHPGIRTEVYDSDGNFVAVFDSAKQAAKFIKEQLGTDTEQKTIQTAISRNLNGTLKQYKGFQFREEGEVGE